MFVHRGEHSLIYFNWELLTELFNPSLFETFLQSGFHLRLDVDISGRLLKFFTLHTSKHKRGSRLHFVTAKNKLVGQFVFAFLDQDGTNNANLHRVFVQLLLDFGLPFSFAILLEQLLGLLQRLLALGRDDKALEARLVPRIGFLVLLENFSERLLIV